MTMWTPRWNSVYSFTVPSMITFLTAKCHIYYIVNEEYNIIGQS